MDHSRPLIAHVIYKLDVGGLENGLINLINTMPSDRYRHVILCLKGYSDFRDRLQVPAEVIDLGKKEGKDPKIYFKLWRLFRKLRPSIVHTRNLATLDAALPAFLAGIRVRIHGEHGRDIGDLDGKNAKNRFLRKLFAPLVTRFIALSQDLENTLLEIGIPQWKTTQIYNGVDVDRFSSSENKEDPTPFGEDVVVVGTVGRMQPVKNQTALARAFVRIILNEPALRKTLRLALIGDGPLREECFAILRSAKCEDLAWLPGTRNNTDAIFKHLDVFVLPSLAEGVSNTILEAMASGLPVVATRVGGNPELVVDGETGMLVPAGDHKALAEALLCYVKNREKRLEHGASGRARVLARHSMMSMAGSYLSVYDQALCGDAKH